MLTIENILLDYAQFLQGTEQFPLVGWQIHSDKKNVIQQSWQLQVSEDAAFTQILHDTGRMESVQSQNIQLTGIELVYSRRYFVRVKISDDYGEESSWSQPAEFITGLPAEKWQGAFISAEQPEDNATSKGSLLRKAFYLDRVDDISSVVVHASALGIYQFYCNGQRVGNDELTPGWTSYHHHLLYQTYDLTPLLQEGKNAVAASLGAGWYKGDMSFNRYRNYYGDRTAFICQVVIHYKDGRQQTLVTDELWRASDSPVLFSEIYDGETYDARLEQAGWNDADFDDSQWRSVSLIDADKAVLRPQGTATVQQIETIDPVAVLITPQGDTVVDFGQNLTGWVSFTVKGNVGDKVVLRHFEVLDADGNVYLANLRTAKQRIEYTLKGGEEEHYHPHFTFQGFRYVKIESWPGTFDIHQVKAVVVHSQMQQAGDFSCSNPYLNQLHHNILWGLKGNFVDVPTDCPQRDERLGWTGDAQIFCRTASYLMQTRNFFAKWLTDLRHDQTAEGGVPHVIPDILTDRCDEDRFLAQGNTHSAAAWADAAVIAPWTMYLMYGDTTTLRNQYASMKGWIDFMRAHAVDNHWRYKLQFGDWVALDAKEGSYFGATPNELTCMAYYAWSTLLFAKAAKVLSHEADYQEYFALYQRIVHSFQQAFFTPTGRLAVRTQTAHILALHFNLVPGAFRERTINTLLELLAEHDGHLVTGFVGTPYFCHALSQNGHAKEAWDLLLKDDFPSWLYQVKAGATTIWEHWDGIKPDGSMWSADMNSFNHYAYGAIGEWLYRAAAGIDTDESGPGFKQIRLKPLIGGGLEWLNARYHSLYGDIKVGWKVVPAGEGVSRVTMEVDIPPNTQATITLVDAEEIIADDGVDFQFDNEGRRGVTGSGHYHFEYCLPTPQ